ncbi:MAG TPA: glycolate oxidase subunit GlcE [Gammaproteobacteria bacterium]|nr:glycolate oxidase subunit GlcE [Gammaproteobacteria bacterium]
MPRTNCSQALQEQILQALSEQKTLQPCGGHSKDFYGRTVNGEKLSCAGHRGILNYEPKELVLTAKSGTPLQEIEAILAERGQMLAFEPPHFGPGTTLGGVVAAGLAGPARAYRGSVRDYVLGVRVINGHGQILHFGGEVIKNVAGYDISRLLTGSLGTLALLLEVSLKVLPLPEAETTISMSCDSTTALQHMLTWSRQALPITATAWYRDQLYCRLSGERSAVHDAISLIGGDENTDGSIFWTALREQTLPAFTASKRLWRLSVPPTTLLREESGEVILEWGGALRWCCENRHLIIDKTDYWDYAKTVGGHATCFRGAKPGTEVFQPLPSELLALHQRLKLAFDPKSLFNPGHLYGTTAATGL